MATGAASGQTLTTLYNFGSGQGDGSFPQAGIVFDQAGNLYGTTSIGGISGANGIVFQLQPPVNPGDPWTEVIPTRFQGSPDGKVPEGRVTLASSGKLFGTTYQGGAKDMGSVFELRPPASSGGPWKKQVIYSFGKSAGDGVNPNAGLLPASGVFFGVTFGGGAAGRGTVFQLTPPATAGGAWTEAVLYSFAASGDAAFPSSELVADKSGNLYGTTTLGGVNDLGAVYQLSPPAAAGNPWTESVIFSFNGTDGTLPAGRLLLDASGNLYGTTDGGGAGGEGTVFQLAPPAMPGDPWTETVLYSFSGGVDGSNPAGGVVMDKSGRLYGTAQHGGNGAPKFGGVVFMLTPPAAPGDPWTETVLHAFTGNDGFGPASLLTLRKGALYGTTTQGGLFGLGTVFMLIP